MTTLTPASLWPPDWPTQKTPSPATPAPPPPARLPRPQTVMGLFFVGTLAGAGASLLHQGPTAIKTTGQLVEKTATTAGNLGQLVAEVVHHQPPASTTTLTSELNLFAKNWEMLFTAASKAPQLMVPVGTYWGVAGIGFVAANVVQGLQEAWVRWEESCIRAQLVGRLKDSFQTSIEIKQQQDDRNRAQAHEAIGRILQQHGITPEVDSTVLPPSPDNLAAHRNFFYMPANRTTPATEPLFGSQSPIPLAPSNYPAVNEEKTAPDWVVGHARGLFKGLAAGVGVLSGYLAGYSLKHLGDAIANVAQPINKKTYLNAEDGKAVFIDLFSEGRYRPLLGMLALGSLIGVGKQALTGLREVEVTRLNAETEFRYEQFKWLSLDTMYHDVAEKTQINHALAQLDESARLHASHPQTILQQAQAIERNISNWSPPPYYPVVPVVQLEAARS